MKGYKVNCIFLLKKREQQLVVNYGYPLLLRVGKTHRLLPTVKQTYQLGASSPGPPGFFVFWEPESASLPLGHLLWLIKLIVLTFW